MHKVRVVIKSIGLEKAIIWKDMDFQFEPRDGDCIVIEHNDNHKSVEIAYRFHLPDGTLGIWLDLWYSHRINIEKKLLQGWTEGDPCDTFPIGDYYERQQV